MSDGLYTQRRGPNIKIKNFLYLMEGGLCPVCSLPPVNFILKIRAQRG